MKRDALAIFMKNIMSALKTPQQTAAFLGELDDLAKAVATRGQRTAPDSPWVPVVDGGARRQRFVRGIRETLAPTVSPRYSVRQRHVSSPAPRPRILHIIPNVFVGGSTQLVVDLHDHLGHAWDMSVLTAALPPGGAHEGMRITRIGLDEPAELFAPAVAAAQPDLIHIHYWGSTDDVWYTPAFAAALATGRPVLQNVNTPIKPFADQRIFHSVFVSNYVRETYGLMNGAESVFYPGIDLPVFEQEPSQHLDALDTVLMVYRLDRDKLDDDAIAPAIAAVKRRPATRVVIVGEGPLLSVFLQQTEEAGVRANFDFRGYVPYGELPDLYANASIFFAPVARESFGQVTPFAMASGLTVVGNDVGALSEILGSHETLGASPRETADLLVRYLDDPIGRCRIGAVNKERARMFSVQAMCSSYSALYDEALASGSAPVV